jgi:hypothetical protein
MQVRRFSDPISFLNRAESFLMRGEAENSMMLGIRGLPGARPPRFGEDCYLAVVEDGEDIAACSLTRIIHEAADFSESGVIVA